MVHSAEAHLSCYQPIPSNDNKSRQGDTHISADWVLCYIGLGLMLYHFYSGSARYLLGLLYYQFHTPDLQQPSVYI